MTLITLCTSTLNLALTWMKIQIMTLVFACHHAKKPEESAGRMH